MTLLLYAYCVGERSSRRIKRLCLEDVAFLVITANRKPGHVTIACFRQRHARELAQLFSQVLGLCREAGLGKVGVVALGLSRQSRPTGGGCRAEGPGPQQVR